MYAVLAFLSIAIAGIIVQANNCETLKKSKPVKVVANGQVIKNLDIVTSDLTPGIYCFGKTGVTIENVRVTHHDQAGGTTGIKFEHCPNMTIRNSQVQMLGIIGAKESKDWKNYNINGFKSDYPIIHDVIVSGGASGIFMDQSYMPHVHDIVAYNVHGPFPKGQCVQFVMCTYGILENFICKNQWEYSWPEDTISMWRSPNTTVRNGVLFGNNAQNGVTVMFEQSMPLDHSWGLLQNVYGSQMASGFSVYGGTNVVFQDVGLRDNHCDGKGGRPKSSSGGLMYYAGYENPGQFKDCCPSKNIKCRNCQWYNTCEIVNGKPFLITQNGLHNPDAWVEKDLVEKDFKMPTDKYHVELCFTIEGKTYQASSKTEDNVGLFGDKSVEAKGPASTTEMFQTSEVVISAFGFGALLSASVVVLVIKFFQGTRRNNQQDEGSDHMYLKIAA